MEESGFSGCWNDVEVDTRHWQGSKDASTPLGVAVYCLVASAATAERWRWEIGVFRIIHAYLGD